MAHDTLDRVLEELDNLAPDELEQVGEAVRARLVSEEAARREAFHRALQAAGLVREFRRPRLRPAECTREQVQGKPVS